MQRAGGCVTVEVADGFPQAALDAFLDEEIGRDRENMDIVVLRRFAKEMPAGAAIIANTGWTSSGDWRTTRSTSAVAACCARASTRRRWSSRRADAASLGEAGRGAER